MIVSGDYKHGAWLSLAVMSILSMIVSDGYERGVCLSLAVMNMERGSL